MNLRATLVVGIVLAILGTTGCTPRQQAEWSAPPPTSPTTSGASSDPDSTPTPKAGNGSKQSGPGPSNQLPPGLLRTTGARGVALTFDDGPHPIWTPKVLDQLRAQNVKAVFCVVGTKVRSHPELVSRIVREGHQLCNHSWRHDISLGSKPAATIRADLSRTNAEIQRAVPGVKVSYYRQPGGRWTPELVTTANALGMQSLHWAVDPQDWARPTTAVISKRVISNTRAGSIVLLHDGGGDRRTTLAALPTVIKTLQARYGIIGME